MVTYSVFGIDTSHSKIFSVFWSDLSDKTMKTTFCHAPPKYRACRSSAPFNRILKYTIEILNKCKDSIIIKKVCLGNFFKKLVTKQINKSIFNIKDPQIKFWKPAIRTLWFQPVCICYKFVRFFVVRLLQNAMTAANLNLT